MNTSVTLPDLGVRPGSRITLSAWFALPGDFVCEGDRLVEVLTDGATFDVAAPATGWLSERRVLPREPVETGQVLGVIDSAARGAQSGELFS